MSTAALLCTYRPQYFLKPRATSGNRHRILYSYQLFRTDQYEHQIKSFISLCLSLYFFSSARNFACTYLRIWNSNYLSSDVMILVLFYMSSCSKREQEILLQPLFQCRMIVSRSNSCFFLYIKRTKCNRYARRPFSSSVTGTCIYIHQESISLNDIGEHLKCYKCFLVDPAVFYKKLVTLFLGKILLTPLYNVPRWTTKWFLQWFVRYIDVMSVYSPAFTTKLIDW